MHDPEESKKNLQIKILNLLDHHLHRRVDIESPAVGPVRPEGRIYITHTDDPRAQRDRFPGKIVRITGPVIVFMMVQYGFQDKLGIAVLFQSLISEVGVHPHIFQLFYHQSTLFPSVNIPLKSEFAYVMQKAPDSRLVAHRMRQIHLLCHSKSKIAHDHAVS